MTGHRPGRVRLIMVSGDFPPRLSGVGDYSYHVAETASMMGTDVTVVTTGPKPAPDLPQTAHVDVRNIMSCWQFCEANKILRVLRESSEKTVLNIQYYCPATYGRRLMINFLPSLARTLRSNTRVVVTLHGFWEQSLLYRLRTLPMLRAAHGVIYVDRLNRALIKKYSGLAEARLKYIPIAGNIPPIPCTDEMRNEWRQELGLTAENVVLAFFGGIGRNKGFEYLLQAMYRIREKASLPIVLLAVGGFHSDDINDLYPSKIHDLIVRLGLESHVKIFEGPSATLVSRYLHIADVAAFPFLCGVGENSGSMLAALAHGLPTVITEGPANDAGFPERFGVVMVPPQDAERLADTIIELVTSSVRRRELRKKAINVSSCLNWEFVTGETMSFFESLF
jgi:glycosyltransferase involved in cell wall biosynthesis